LAAEDVALVVPGVAASFAHPEGHALHWGMMLWTPKEEVMELVALPDFEDQVHSSHWSQHLHILAGTLAPSH